MIPGAILNSYELDAKFDIKRKCGNIKTLLN